MKTKIGLSTFSLILLAAHFSRMNFPLILAIIALLSPLLFFYKKRFSINIIQIILLLGTLEWIRAAIFYIQQRMDMGAPWLRLAVILGLIIVLCAYSAWILSSNEVKKRYL
jgi:heme/copper-type cytochrome/quinol oxidase subunit 3